MIRIIHTYLLLSLVITPFTQAQNTPATDSKYVSLKDAHDGRLAIDLKILNQFQDQPANIQNFYTHGRDALLRENPERKLAEICEDFGLHAIGGPMLGNLTASSITIRVHTPQKTKVTITIKSEAETNTFNNHSKNRISHIKCNGLTPSTTYSYKVIDANNNKLGKGSFTTPPSPGSRRQYKIAIGADFHKIGLHRPELLSLVQKRSNLAMMLLGDLAVDGRRTIPERNIDYLLRDVSPIWKKFAANVPSMTSWDDHDYFGNDTHGQYYKNKENKIPVDALRTNWKLMWNNPERNTKRNGIYFQTVIGDAHIIMLDTRSCRVNEKRGKINSFLGEEQMSWLKKTLQDSKSPVILLSGGTMWTDYISNGKDSWGTWDKKGREEIFKILDELADKKILLFSGDRHGTHAFGIKRPNGREYIEFGVGTLGGVPGGGKAIDQSTQLFAYPGNGFWGFGELEFTYPEAPYEKPKVIFRLINQEEAILETIEL